MNAGQILLQSKHSKGNSKGNVRTVIDFEYQEIPNVQGTISFNF